VTVAKVRAYCTGLLWHTEKGVTGGQFSPGDGHRLTPRFPGDEMGDVTYDVRVGRPEEHGWDWGVAPAAWRAIMAKFLLPDDFAPDGWSWDDDPAAWDWLQLRDAAGTGKAHDSGALASREELRPFSGLIGWADPTHRHMLACSGSAGLEPAVLATLRWAGLRAGELCTLPLSGLDLDAQLLTVVGKGTKQRTIPLPEVLTEHLDHYLHEVRPTLPASPLLFTNPYGQQTGQPLTGRALLDLCRSAGANTSITGPHTALRWRHTYATLSMARGVDLYVVSRLLGHARVETTQRYLHLDTGALSDAIRRAYP